MKKCAGAAVAFPMNSVRTAIDANLLIAAWSAQSALFERALAILEDPDRTLIVSDALWLEVMPKAIYHAHAEECAFYQAVFARGEYITWSSEIVASAKHLAQSYGLAAMDAIHLAVALAAGASEFISGEKPGKPMFRVKEISARSLWGIVP
ncbi:MAG: PIN domain-containing protein [Chromatiaceae bacterium]|nr:PIN domain-containing protein [Chromatiaceae bacterium]